MLWFFQWSCMDVRVGLWRKLTAEELMLLESSLDWKEIQSVHPKGNQSWIFIGRTDAEAATPTFWPLDAESWLIWKDPDAGKDWGQEEKGLTEDEMVGWHHWLNGHGFGWTLGVGDGQGSLVCCSAWGHNELDMTEWLNWNELYPKQMWAKFAVKTVCNNKNPWFQNCLLSTSYQHSTNIQKSKIYRRTNFRNT